MIDQFTTLPLRSGVTDEVYVGQVEQFLTELNPRIVQINGEIDKINAQGGLYAMGGVGGCLEPLTIGSPQDISVTTTLMRGWYHGQGHLWTARSDKTKQMLVICDTYDPITGAYTGSVPEGQTAGEGTFDDWEIGPAASSTSVGKQTIPLTAGHLTPRTTNPARVAQDEVGANKVMRRGLKFSGTVQEYAEVTLPMPKAWNGGTVTARLFGEHGALGGANHTAVFAISAMARGDGDATNTAFGAAKSVTISGANQDTTYVSAESDPITIAGDLTYPCLVTLLITRTISDPADLMSEDLILTALHVYIVTDAETDA